MANFQDFYKLAGLFVEKTQGEWNHAEWESFLVEVQKRNVELSEQTIKYIGEIMEATKNFYGSLLYTPTESEDSEQEG